MRKIPTLFARDEATNRKYVRNEVTPGCEWVLAGEGTPTRKYDGTCCLIRDGVIYARREVKPGKQPPEGFEEVGFDDVTGKRVGWVRCDDTPEYARHKEAFLDMVEHGYLSDGTYELCGPKVNGNPEGLTEHHLIPHDEADVLSLGFAMSDPDAFEKIGVYLRALPHEGVVWHHPDGRMAKLKRRDFAAAEGAA